MKKKRIVFIGIIFLITILFTSSVSLAATRVAVIGFQAQDLSWIKGNKAEKELLNDITDIFNEKLAETEEYAVLNTDRMSRILKEINYNQGKRPTHSIVNQLKNKLDADFFIFGSLDNVDMKKTRTFKAGPLEFTEIELTMTLSVELINARSWIAKVEKTFSGRGRVSKTGLYFTESDDDDEAKISINDDILEMVITRAIDDLIDNITERREVVEDTEENRIEAEIVSIVRDKLAIDKGERHGLELGQRGQIVRYKSSSQLIVIGEAEVRELDRTSALLETVNLHQEPETGDVFIITIDDDSDYEDGSYRSPVEILETEDFTIKIIEADKSDDRVTIRGTARAKENNVELEIILSNKDFYDHEGERRDMSGRRVSLGDWVNSSSRIASISETFARGETKDVSWSFTGVPEEADEITFIKLWLKTSREGEISLNLRDLELN